MNKDWDLISVQTTDPDFGFQIGNVALRTHGPKVCEGQNCCIHNPSDHHMKTWPQNWRADRKLMERICPHGIVHPDPDHKFMRGEQGIHGCDGCCAT